MIPFFKIKTVKNKYNLNHLSHIRQLINLEKMVTCNIKFKYVIFRQLYFTFLCFDILCFHILEIKGVNLNKEIHQFSFLKQT